MSTTPMHRPFLVGQSPVDQTPAPHLVSRNPGNHGLGGRDMPYHGLHLVPATRSKQTILTGPFQNNYKMAAAAAALLLVLAVV